MGHLLSSTLLYIDKKRMSQVIRNIVSNAMKFTPRGGKVTISASHIHDSIDLKNGGRSVPHKMLRIEVKDTGAGISQVIYYH